tara:strand:- start:18 stop:374 length:357 start_codon:yes stop_codon:yes gene_type:complete
MNDFRKFLKGYNIKFNINESSNQNEYDYHEIRKSITKKNIDKIFSIYKYEYTNYYRLEYDRIYKIKNINEKFSNSIKKANINLKNNLNKLGTNTYLRRVYFLLIFLLLLIMLYKWFCK